MISKNVLFERFFSVIFFFIVAAVALMGQLLKHKIRQSGGFYVCNPGISFGLMIPSFLFWFISCLVLVFIFANISYLHKNSSSLFMLGSGLFIGGAVSNIFDRIFLGCVFDYLSTPWQFLPVFNFADTVISIGTVLLVLHFFKSK